MSDLLSPNHPNFYILRMGDYRDFKFGVQVDHRKYQPVDDKLSLKGAWSRDLFNFWEIIGNISEMVQT